LRQRSHPGWDSSGRRVAQKDSNSGLFVKGACFTYLKICCTSKPWTLRIEARTITSSTVNRGIRIMQIILRCIQISQILRAAMCWLSPNSSLSQVTSRRFLMKAGPEASNRSRLRAQVLRRDRYRCRGCDKKGDEITLAIHGIEPNVAEAESMVTLCMNCQALARTHKLKGHSLPEFLRRLWYCLHHPAPIVSI
jgi:hypothetical protein